MAIAKTTLKCYCCQAPTNTTLIIADMPYPLCNECLYEHVVNNKKAIDALKLIYGKNGVNKLKQSKPI